MSQLRVVDKMRCIVIIQLERQLEINREVLQHVWLVAHVILVSAQVLLVLTLGLWTWSQFWDFGLDHFEDKVINNVF